MQIATIAPKPPVHSLAAPIDVAGPGPDNPIGVTSYGTMRIGHALNGIRYTEHKLTGPLQAPVREYTGSLQDAIAGATRDLANLEMTAVLEGRFALALLGMGNSWRAQMVHADPTVLRAIDNGPGRGGIASISFPSMARSLGAIVTSKGSLIPSQLRGH